MNVLIISTNRHLLPVPVMPIGACIVAEAAALAGHSVRLLDLMFEKDPIRKIEDALRSRPPDVIGLSVRNIDNNDMQNPVFFIREIVPFIHAIRGITDVPLVLGGAAVSVMPEEIMRYTGISCACTGDGEAVFPELLSRLSGGLQMQDVSGVAWLEDEVFINNRGALKSISHPAVAPDLSRWINVKKYLSRLSTIPVQTKLGCHFRCIYCTYRRIEGSSYRFFDQEGIIENIRKAALSGGRDIEFVDNVFNSPYEHAMVLCERLAGTGRGLRLHTLELNPMFVDDVLITAMEKAGFRSIGITAESASDRVLQGLGKGFSADSVYKAAEVVGRHNIPCLWIFMAGGPGETHETLRETLRFARERIRPRDAAFFNIGVRIYPGTELESVARNQGLLSIPSSGMLAPVFYVSPETDTARMLKQVRASLDSHMNFINSDSIGMSFLPSLHRAGYGLGIRPPLWRYTPFIRRGLRMIGIDA